MRTRNPKALVVLILALVVVWALREYGVLAPEAPAGPGSRPEGDGVGPQPPERSPDGSRAGPTDDALARAIRQRRSKVWVEGEGRIVHLLKDDRDPPRHQRCLADVLDGHTIKISHNIDLAPRVPWEKGQRIRFRGRFEWNDKGGVVHWTHRDPGGRHQGGWLELDGRRYR